MVKITEDSLFTIIPASRKEAELIDKKLAKFNNSQVPFTQKQNPTPAFYLKHGYEIFGILEDCPKGHKRYYLKKSLV